MRQIDADELKTAFPCGESVRTESVRATIDNMATVDAEPVRHGHWEMKEDPYGFFDEIPVCSECGHTTKLRETYKYCPNCGARMDERRENGKID